MDQILSTGVLVLIIYLIHRLIHKVDMVGFAAAVAIALSTDYYMRLYLGVNELTAMIITIVIFPILEGLWAMAVTHLKREEKVHHRHMFHPHIPHPHMPRWGGDMAPNSMPRENQRR